LSEINTGRFLGKYYVYGCRLSHTTLASVVSTNKYQYRTLYKLWALGYTQHKVKVDIYRAFKTKG